MARHAPISDNTGASSITRKVLRIAIRIALASVVLGTVAAGIGVAALRYAYQESAYVAGSRILMPELVWQRDKYPSVRVLFDFAINLLAEERRLEFTQLNGRVSEITDQQPGHPYIGSGVTRRLPAVLYDNEGRPQPTPGKRAAKAGLALWEPPYYSTNVVTVSDPDELTKAIRNAIPGTYILMNPGEYVFRGHDLPLKAAGRAFAPITVGAAQLGDVRIKFNLLEGFHMRAPYWIIENLEIEGICGTHSYCEHAFHIVGSASNVVIRNNRVINFNAPVKINGDVKRGNFPDNGLIEYSSFYNQTARTTDNPVTLIDVVAANGWRVSANFIADFAKNGADFTSYAGFFKGAGRENIFERNLVMCEWKHKGGVRIGLSLGGGGSSPRSCRDGKCETEDTDSIIRNNIVMSCPNDIGIYLNKAANSMIVNNAVLGTRGIDVRYGTTTAKIVNNTIDGRILNRDGGQSEADNNVISIWKAISHNPSGSQVYADPASGDFRLMEPDMIIAQGSRGTRSDDDFCGRTRSEGAVDIGPFSYQHQDACLPIIETGTTSDSMN